MARSLVVMCPSVAVEEVEGALIDAQSADGGHQ